MHILTFMLVGLLAGWLAGTVTRGQGLGVFADIGVGIVGAFIGAYLFSAMGLLAYGFIGHVVMAFLGAVVLLLVVGLFRRSRV
jgi:uncharacterized membrane protein YeaQ/YmgE (transglycosylase-associated protein family)